MTGSGARTIVPAPMQLIFVCRECEDGRDLRRWLEKRVRGRARVVKTGCMGLCPEDRVSVSVGGRCHAVDAGSKKQKRALLAIVS